MKNIIIKRKAKYAFFTTLIIFIVSMSIPANAQLRVEKFSLPAYDSVHTTFVTDTVIFYNPLIDKLYYAQKEDNPISAVTFALLELKGVILGKLPFGDTIKAISIYDNIDPADPSCMDLPPCSVVEIIFFRKTADYGVNIPSIDIYLYQKK